jgi:hypothetical protein
MQSLEMTLKMSSAALLFSVNGDILFQFTGEKKGLRTLGATERSLTGVYYDYSG